MSIGARDRQPENNNGEHYEKPVNRFRGDAPRRARAQKPTKPIKRKTEKFGNPLGALNETIKLSVEQFLDDPEFVKAIN